MTLKKLELLHESEYDRSNWNWWSRIACVHAPRPSRQSLPLEQKHWRRQLNALHYKLLSSFRTEDTIENTVSLFVTTCCFVRLTSLYTTLALRTWSGIVAHSYFPEAGNNFTSSQVYFINQHNTKSQKKLFIAFNQAAYTTIANLLTQFSKPVILEQKGTIFLSVCFADI